MKNAVIFHAAGSTPESFWYPYMKTELEKLGYRVWIPQLPNTDKPDIEKLLPFALENSKYDEQTVLIGHSIGCPLILSILENISATVEKSILVAGFSTKPDPFKILQSSYDWKRIKKHSKNFIFINSDNDPWGCNDKQGRKMFDRLGGTLVIRHGEGHMGSEKFDQPYKKFPLLVKLTGDF